jgi:spermidine/putrescine-binding protein
MGYYLPESGTNMWSDAMVIPKNAENPELAYEFINYVSTYEPAMDNSSYVGYTSPNADVIVDLTAADGDFNGIESYLPRTGYEKDEVFSYDKEIKKVLSELWNKVKIYASNN